MNPSKLQFNCFLQSNCRQFWFIGSAWDSIKTVICSMKFRLYNMDRISELWSHSLFPLFDKLKTKLLCCLNVHFSYRHFYNKNSPWCVWLRKLFFDSSDLRRPPLIRSKSINQLRCLSYLCYRARGCKWCAWNNDRRLLCRLLQSNWSQKFLLP